jgi:hypothetical protein
MAFMFKGPAALTGASTISTTGNIVTTSSGTLTIDGTSTLTGAVTTTAGLTVGNALTVSTGGAAITGNSAITGTLSVSQAITATSGITMSGATVSSIERGSSPDASSDIIASKKYVAEQIAGVSSGGGESPTIVAPSGNTLVLTPAATTGNRLFLINGSAYSGSSEMTLNVSSSAPATGSTWTFVWIKQSGGGSTGVKIDFGTDKLVSASGANQRYLTIDDVGGSARVVYTTEGGVNQWFLIGSSAIPS